MQGNADEEEDDEFGTAFFTEQLLGELGSSSGSHKDAFEDEDNNGVIDGDSGASDRGSANKAPTPLLLSTS